MCACVGVCVCVGVSKRRHKEKEGKERRIHAQKLLALDFRNRPSVTDAYELIYINLY